MNHLDLDALADLLVGEARPQEIEHLNSCPTCAQQLADLDAAQAPVTVALAALPPLVLPPALARQLTEPAIGPRPAASEILPLAARRHAPLRSARRRPPWLAPAAGVAAAAVLVAGGVALLGHAGQHTAATSSGSAAGGVAPAPQVRRVATGTDYTAATLATQLPPLLSGPALPGPALSGPALSGPALPGSAQPSPAATGSTRATSGPVPGPAAASRATGTVPAGLEPLQGTAALAACLSALTPPDQPGLPLAVDYARYAGKPALVVVLPSTRPGKVDVYVVGPHCTAADADVVSFTRLARP